MLALTVDFGSTFTKAVVIDLDAERVVARSISPSTVNTDITVGLKQALASIPDWPSLEGKLNHRLGCSSAAGGLKVAAIGLVPELTGEAARQAALGAGGKVVAVFSHKMTPGDLGRLENSKPDIVLLSGGTDGGDIQTVEHNGRLLSHSKLDCPTIVACNREAAPQVNKMLSDGGKVVVQVDNVMPELGRLNVEPARQIIRELFIKHIIRAKGLEKAKAFVDLVMPTPSASLQATRLLAEGTPDEPGVGEVMVVEVGGATTNVHSVFDEPQQGANVIRKGLEEERVKRTVEGDLGVRVSAPSLLVAAGLHTAREMLGAAALEHETLEKLAGDTGRLPHTNDERSLDSALARLAVRIAVERHVGRLEQVSSPTGRFFLQMGKNFSTLENLVGSGGPIVYSSNPTAVLEEAMHDEARPDILKPKSPRKLIDRDYVLWSMGLLSTRFPDAALRMLKKSLRLA